MKKSAAGNGGPSSGSDRHFMDGFYFVPMPDISDETAQAINDGKAMPAFIGILRALHQQGRRGCTAAARADARLGRLTTGINALARASGMTEPAIRRQLAHLQRLGIIRVQAGSREPQRDPTTGRIVRGVGQVTPKAILLTLTEALMRPSRPSRETDHTPTSMGSISFPKESSLGSISFPKEPSVGSISFPKEQLLGKETFPKEPPDGSISFPKPDGSISFPKDQPLGKETFLKGPEFKERNRPPSRDAGSKEPASSGCRGADGASRPLGASVTAATEKGHGADTGRPDGRPGGMALGLDMATGKPRVAPEPAVPRSAVLRAIRGVDEVEGLDTAGSVKARPVAVSEAMARFEALAEGEVYVPARRRPDAASG